MNKKIIILCFSILFFITFVHQADGIEAVNNQKLIKKGIEEIQKRNFDNAINYFEKAVSRDAYDMESLYLLAAAYYSNEDYKNSKRVLIKMLTLDPRNTKAESLLKSVNKILDKSKPPKKKSKDLKEQNIINLLEDAEATSKTINKKEAIEKYYKILKLDRKNYKALISLILLEDKFGNNNKIITCFDTLIKYYPEKKEIYDRLLDHLTRNVKIDTAINIALQYKKWGASLREINKIIINLYLRGQKFKKAEKLIKKVLKKYPHNREYLLSLSKLYKSTNNLRGEIDALKEIHKFSKNDPEIIFMLSKAYERGGVNDLAFTILMAIPPEKREKKYFTRLIKLGKKVGENELVSGAYNNLIEDTKNNISLQLDHIDFLIAENKLKKAIDTIFKYLKTAPGEKELIKRLKEIGINSKDDNIAFTALKKYVTLFPNSYANRRRLLKLSKKLNRKINISLVNKDNSLNIFTDIEFRNELLILENYNKKIKDRIMRRIKKSIIYEAEFADYMYKYCNIKALEKLLNELYMSPDDSERLISYKYLLDYFIKNKLNGVILFLKYKQKSMKFDTRVITVTNSDKNLPVIKQDTYLSPSKPSWIYFPEKIEYDNEIAFTHSISEFDKDRILERYKVFTMILSRIETEKREIIKDLNERTTSRVQADIFKNMKIIRHMTSVMGVQPRYLKIYTNSIINSISEDFEIELLDEMERTYALLGYIIKKLDDKAKNILVELNRKKTEEEKKASLLKYFDKDDGIFKILNLKTY